MKITIYAKTKEQLKIEIKELKVGIEGSKVGQQTIIDVMSKLSGNGLGTK